MSEKTRRFAYSNITTYRVGEPQRFVLLPLTAAAAARVIRRHFDRAAIRELVRELHWGGEEDK